MNKTIVFFLQAFIACIPACGQNSVLQSGKTWEIHYRYGNPTEPKLCFQMDSVGATVQLDGTDYYEVFTSDPDANGGDDTPRLSWYMREVGLQVFALGCDGEERLCYDFSLDEGTQLEVMDLYGYGHTVHTTSLTVYKTGLATVGNTSLRMLWMIETELLGIHTSQLQGQELATAIEQDCFLWIEGVGSNAGLTHPDGTVLPGGRGYHLVICKEPGGRIYTENMFDTILAVSPASAIRQPSQNIVYDLAGRRHQADMLKKSIYVKNGRKHF